MNDVASEKSTSEIVNHARPKKLTSSSKKSSHRSSKKSKSQIQSLNLDLPLLEPAHPNRNLDNDNAAVELVTFLPNGEGELKDIPGFGQVLETRSLEDGKLIRYPISALGTTMSFFPNSIWHIVVEVFFRSGFLRFSGYTGSKKTSLYGVF